MHQSENEAIIRARDGIYYGSLSEDVKLPVLTFAPELCNGGVIKFDGKTDVWAFGITLIELYQLGKPPYQNFQSTKDIIMFVRTYGVHEKPKFCPDAVYDRVITACLSQRIDRPTMYAVTCELRSLMEKNEYNPDRNKQVSRNSVCSKTQVTSAFFMLTY